eukprot:12329266-Prorocentrum_lima.AAC.1
MTSSLVGSEMCIRDRVPKPQSTSTPQSEQGGQEAFESSSFATATAAVSYTHLTLPTICSV